MKIKDLAKLLSTLPQEASCSITLYDDGTPLQIGVPSSKKTESAPTPSPAKPKAGNPNVLSATEKKKRTKKATDLIKSMNNSGGDETTAAQSIMDEFQVSKKQADKIVADVSKKHKLVWGEESLPFESDDPMDDLKTI